MRETADLNLVLAVVAPRDPLRERALTHLSKSGPLLVPFSVGIELLFVAKRFGLDYVDAIGAAGTHFDVENEDVLLTAAEALRDEDVGTVFDAVHLADAYHRGGTLHTADRGLHRTDFPTVGY